eukprot:CAMPEP_0119115800 /NCGR_PEP_ID=MMETSP1180-20130426/51938_1 /TAXON_ID=3052 ORGANISM="Chlamydomonas cf sp, Strain CCMP681" /NCGR_SAMPLE_ID=MMETSP1180 /ASSEMBLY_ACC=CAM_ASM_000741 /LENGTH=258 /DNA_ID=CAMNT_0007104893 /DNA_START=136 /DNA_END=913 /DNA_ORIENTATION=-
MGSKSWSQMVWEAMYMLSYGGTSDDKQGYDRCGRLPFISTVTTQLKEAPSVWDEFIGTYPHMEHLTQDGLLQELKHKSLCIQIEEQQSTEQLLQIGLVRDYWVDYFFCTPGKQPFINAHLDAVRSLQAEMEQNMAKTSSVWDEFIGTYPHMGHLTQDGLLQELKHKCLCIQIEEQQLTEQLLQIGLVHNYWVHYYEGLGKYPFINAHLDAVRTLQAEMEHNMAKLKDRKAELRCSLEQLMSTKQQGQEQHRAQSPVHH